MGEDRVYYGLVGMIVTRRERERIVEERRRLIEGVLLGGRGADRTVLGFGELFNFLALLYRVELGCCRGPDSSDMFAGLSNFNSTLLGTIHNLLDSQNSVSDFYIMLIESELGALVNSLLTSPHRLKFLLHSIWPKSVPSCSNRENPRPRTTRK